MIKACKKGYEKFEKYFNIMKENDIYFLASTLDPRIKTRIIRKYLPKKEADEMIKRIISFLKATYHQEVELPGPQKLKEYKSLESSFLEEYESAAYEVLENDIDKYYDTPPVKFLLNKDEDQTVWNLNWWNGNKWDFVLMFQAARDYLAICAAESDIERLFNDGRDIFRGTPMGYGRKNDKGSYFVQG